MQGWNHISYVSCTGRQVLYHQSDPGSPRQPSNVTEKLLYNIPSLPHWYLLYFLVAKSCPNLCKPWAVACQAPLSMDFPRQEHWSGLPFPPLGDLPTQGSNSHLLHWQVGSLPLSHVGSPTLAFASPMSFAFCILLWFSSYIFYLPLYSTHLGPETVDQFSKLEQHFVPRFIAMFTIIREDFPLLSKSMDRAGRLQSMGSQGSDRTQQLNLHHHKLLGLPLWLSWVRVHLQCGRPGFSPWVGKTPWRTAWLPTPVFWPGEFHGLYSLQDCKESDMTE